MERIRRWLGVLRRQTAKRPPLRFAAGVAKVYFSCRVSRSAAALAYFLVLTFFPILICLSAFAGQDLERLIETAEQLLPAGVVALLEEYLVYVERRPPGMLAVGVISTVFFASAAVRVLMKVTGEICGGRVLRGWRQMAASVALSLLLLVTIYASAAAVITGDWFFRALFRGPEKALWLWQWAKYLTLLGVVFLFVFLLYRFTVPPRHPRPPVAAGAAAASVALAVSSAVFGWMVGRSARYSLVYGSLASVVVLLVWLYLCGTVLILGVGVNCLIYKMTK